MFLISDLCVILESYLEKKEVETIYQAYLFGAEAHEGQTRKSGEPFIYHPIAVARILAEMRMDCKTLVAAILHDVIEDTETGKETIAQAFGDEVADIVDGLTKLEHLNFNTKAEAKAESFRKLVLAMVQDIRVILIKLADRLHNMRTLGVMTAKKSRRIASETLEIYAPIANRLGMNNIRHELEDLGFQAYNPMRYRILKESVEKVRGNRNEIVKKIQQAIQNRLDEEHINSKVLGREKHIYSVYRKMRKKHLPFSEVFDVYAFRIIVENVDQCYRVLGMVHNLYKPVPGKFKDYVALPKNNGYQSLHSVVYSPYGVPIEIQIRTDEMHKVAEQGIAAHWAYKSDENDGEVLSQTRAREWLKNLLDIQKNAGDSIEFLENVKIDLFPDEVYVFTPKGKIMQLPRNSTAVDFAYAVHTDVGNTCVGVKIDSQLMPLNTLLGNGQTIEIITAKGGRPNPSWLNFVFTVKARSSIRNTLKNLKKEEAIKLGRRLLNKCLNRAGTSLEKIPQERIDELLEEYKLSDFDELLYKIGLGNRIPQLVARSMLPKEVIDSSTACKTDNAGRPLAIKGTEGAVVSYARCCHPLPGDDIIAYMSSGRGIVIHTKDCPNSGEYSKRREKWVDLEWSNDVSGEFSVGLRILAEHKRGVLATVASIISELEANIEHVETMERESNYTFLDFVLTVRDRKHLADIIRHLRRIEMVVKIQRT